jgi:hypothetical protein
MADDRLPCRRAESIAATKSDNVMLRPRAISFGRTKTKSPQTNGICERFHKTALNEFYRVAFRKKVYRSIDDLQADLPASGTLVLRKHPDADLLGCNADDEGENDRGLTATDTKT